ncbi:keto-hydroxyglutarate-aldolase/keto-deoxy-phosphogluconate aldolase [Bacillus sp. NRRL B-14911]|nr:keto-hydroxyglutarate-aldolase/keto-deoxy-phosphogluconate aldolase [Bacillus sp. NRRL B-14911]
MQINFCRGGNYEEAEHIESID